MNTLMSAQLLVAAIAAGSIYALIGTGLNLVYGTVRLLNIAHGDVVMIGAYFAVLAVSVLGAGPLIAIPIAAAVAVLMGVATYYGLFAVILRNRRLAERLESNSLLIFFGISIILQNGVALLFGNNQRSYRYLEQIVTVGDVSITANRLLSFLIALVLVVLLTIVLRRSIWGLALRAVIQSKDAAAIIGLNLPRVYLIALCGGFALAGIAGVLVSMTEQVWPFMGFGFSISSFVVIMLGGLGNVLGGLVAAMLLGFIETYGLALIGPSYRSILIYGVFVGVLLFRPEGLFGKTQARS
jgi:branched-chain amino acid transport system permease protein